MSKIDKCDFISSNVTSRMIIRKRQLYMRDYNPLTDTIKVSLAMFSMLKNLLGLSINMDANGYVSGRASKCTNGLKYFRQFLSWMGAPPCKSLIKNSRQLS